MMRAVGPDHQQAKNAAHAEESTCIALFPGSFKPPHSAHLHAVRYLLDQENVAEVVIIISNRCRLIPGSDYAFDAEAAYVLLKTMLHYAAFPLEKICIEIAEHRAITHALGYFDKVSTTQSLVFCVGSADFATQDDRFARVEKLSRKTGISARIEVLPRAPIDVHATELRRYISDKYAGRKNFLTTLPSEFSEIQKEVIWAECRSSLRPVSAIVKPKIHRALADRYGISLDDLHEVAGRSVDPVFLFRRRSGEKLIVKYAGDTTVNGVFDEEMVPKPAQRLAVERRALRHLATHLDQTFARPAIDFFDKRHRTSVLTSPPGTATYIAAELKAGIFDIDAAAAAARLLAQLHQCPLPQQPFWGSVTRDRDHWKRLINTLGSRSNHKLQELNRIDLTQDLLVQCEPNSRECLLHLCFVPNNLWRHDGHIGVENFERASSYGDPVYDVATFIAQYINAGLLQGSAAGCMNAADAFIATYLHQRSGADLTFPAQLLTYVACHLLAIPAAQGQHCPIRNRISYAVAMLEWVGSESSATQTYSVADVLRDLLNAFVRSE